MKIIINYDMLNAIDILNNPSSKFTLVKCKTRQWLKDQLPILALVDMAICENDLKRLVTILAAQYMLTIVNDEIENKFFGFDYATKSELEKAKRNILTLSSQLQDLNIATNYELLLQSEMYEKRTKFILNDIHLPDLMVQKYIYIPAYDYSGDIKPVSIEQEHIVGTKEYVLTLGKPTHIHDLSLSSI